MPTKPGGYYLKDGTRVPSVTTILSRFKESGGIIHWAWKLGMEGKDYKEVRDAAADAGTLAHDAAEAWVRGESFTWEPDNEIHKKAYVAYTAFLEWARQTNLTVDKTEIPLVSEKYRFGGTFDALMVNGKRIMADYKTSNNTYGDYLAQVAAYGILWEENFPDQPIDGGYYLLRFDKEFGDLHTHWWAELDAGKRYFLALRAAYEEDKELKRRAG